MPPSTPAEPRRGNPAVQLRPVRPSDLPELFDIQCDPASNELAGTKPRSRESFFATWERSLDDPRVNSRIIELERQSAWTIVGSIACFQVEEHGTSHDMVGYWIARPYWGMGIASLAASLFLAEEARRPLLATADAANTASRKILERNGFRLIGVRMGEETDRYVASEIAEYTLD
jgi:RimJ/RimL family protein N-acetyltransferase